MKAGAIHHVAIVVDDLDEAIGTYRRLFGAELELRARLESQRVEAAMLRVGEGRLELIAPLDDESGVARFLAKRGPGMHHVALEVPDVNAALAELERAGATLIDAEPRRGLGGHEVAFVHPESAHGVLVEVVASG
jgi:methylmalonyl-CoA/ethylmalonyl-CoA epimerase